MTPFRWAQVIAIGIGLIPLAAVTIATLRGRRPHPDIVLLACAFALSFVADWIAWKLRADGHSTLWLTYVLAPVQFGLLMAIVQPREHQRIVWMFFVLVVLASLAGGDLRGIEMFVHAGAGAWVALVAYRQPGLERYRAAIVLYCAGAIPYLLGMGFLRPAMDVGWLSMWSGYQLTRLAALSLMAWAVLVQPRMRLEVIADEPRDHRIDGRVRTARTRAGDARHRDRIAVS